MALDFLDGLYSIVTIYWTLIVDTVVNRVQVMLVKEEILSDIWCRPATMFRLTSGSVPLSRCPSLEPNGVFRGMKRSSL